MKNFSSQPVRYIDRRREFTILLGPMRGPCAAAKASEEKIPNEGALAQEMEATETRTVYDFPVAGHLCSDGTVHYVKLSRRPGNPRPQGVCSQCQTTFVYEKPQRSRVRHYDSEGATHF
jgi:hypothetical protein